ncbi:cupin domain-containing protein [Rugosimonospora acidiphila]|uniref:Cupin domain-containing protein n=1 Tax=Rugosimonospora acidiphila TaxID=556531 RepID=A0ABP9RMQ8_9ACTN
MSPDPVPGAAGPFPGGTAVTQLAVYDWSSPDGLRGGSAHVHLACTEGYVVLGGHGRLQTLGPDGYRETSLTPMTVAWFSPGVIHRLINDGDLRILVVMQNGGLPEAGDAVLTFPPEQLTDPATYRRTASLADPARVYATDRDAASHRKNLAVQGFLRLRERVAEQGPGALDEFYRAAGALVADQLEAWRELWSAGAMAAATRTGEQLDALAQGDLRHLRAGGLTVVDPPEERRYGMCGRLTVYEA